MYARASRSVSVATPVYYAHLAAFRGRALLAGDDDVSSLSSGQGDGTELRMNDVHNNIKSTMFYI